MNSNQPIDAWFLQLQPNFGCQKALAGEHLNYMGGEVLAKKAETFSPVSTLEDIDAKKNEYPFEPPWMVSTAFMKQTSETASEEFKTLSGSLKCRGTSNNFLHEDKEFMEFKTFDPLFPKKPRKAQYEMDAPWEEDRKSQPWWQVADEDGLASLVAERAMQHIENNDLPKPTQILRVHGEKLNSHENKDVSGNLSSSGKESQSELFDSMMCSYSISSTNESKSSDGGSWQQPQKNVHGGTQDSYSTDDHPPSSKPTYQNQKAAERAQLLDALRHSQTRAREAEEAAKNAHDEKDHVIKLLFRQASHLFACKQWLKMLQLENICLQLRLKENQITAMFPELPWGMIKEKAAPEEERKDRSKKRGRRQNKEGGFRKAIMFAVGVGIVGAGLLLGWTLGWLLPRL